MKQKEKPSVMDSQYSYRGTPVLLKGNSSPPIGVLEWLNLQISSLSYTATRNTILHIFVAVYVLKIHFGLDSLQKFPHFGLDSLQNYIFATKKIRATPLFMKDKIDYIVMLISEFAKRNNITQRQAYSYISRFKGFELCDRHYGIMHTLSLDDNVNSLSLYCRKNGGTI